jgi:hypothetical protein
MARWRSLGAFVIGNRKYRAGQTYADTAVNALAGDVVYAQFGTSAGLSPLLVPLDSSAIALMGPQCLQTHPDLAVSAALIQWMDEKMDPNLEIPRQVLSQIRLLSDRDLVRLIGAINDHGWRVARDELKLMVEARGMDRRL